MRKISGILAALGVLVVLVQAPPATADRGTHRDADDTPGRLDIRSVTHGHDGKRQVHVIRTYGKWDKRDLSGKNRILLVTKIKGEVLTGVIRWKNGGFFCSIPNDARPCNQMPHLTVIHPNAKTLVIKNLPGPDQKVYRYRVGTRFDGNVDWAPRKGRWVLHRN